MGEAEKAPKAKLRWYQYRLAHLFIFVTICAIPCSWFACRMAKAKRQKAAVEAIEELGGHVWYDYEYDANDDYIHDADPPGPAWFRNLVGLDLLADVVEADVRVRFHITQVGDAGLEHLEHLPDLERLSFLGGMDHLEGLIDLDHIRRSETHIADPVMEHLKGMVKLKELSLHDMQVGDAGLVHLKGLTNLEELDLRSTHVSDAGLEYIKEMTKLERLDLRDTQIGDAGAKHFQELNRLQTLDLAATEVTDGGLRYLQGLTKLQWLDLRCTHVTGRGVKRLRQVLPNCEVLHLPFLID